MALVSLETAKIHLRVPLDATDRDDDISRKVDQASGIVLKHLKSQAVAGWSDGSVDVPGGVEAATLLMVGYLDRFRGDDDQASADTWQAVERLLVGYRDPALA